MGVFDSVCGAIICELRVVGSLKPRDSDHLLDTWNFTTGMEPALPTNGPAAMDVE